MTLLSLKELEVGRLYKLRDGWVTGFDSITLSKTIAWEVKWGTINLYLPNHGIIYVVQKEQVCSRLYAGSEEWVVQVLHKDIVTWIHYLYHNCTGNEYMWEPLTDSIDQR